MERVVEVSISELEKIWEEILAFAEKRDDLPDTLEVKNGILVLKTNLFSVVYTYNNNNLKITLLMIDGGKSSFVLKEYKTYSYGIYIPDEIERLKSDGRVQEWLEDCNNGHPMWCTLISFYDTIVKSLEWIPNIYNQELTTRPLDDDTPLGKLQKAIFGAEIKRIVYTYNE